MGNLPSNQIGIFKGLLTIVSQYSARGIQSEAASPRKRFQNQAEDQADMLHPAKSHGTMVEEERSRQASAPQSHSPGLCDP